MSPRHHIPPISAAHNHGSVHCVRSAAPRRYSYYYYVRFLPKRFAPNRKIYKIFIFCVSPSPCILPCRQRIDDASTTHRRRFADVSGTCFRICRRKQKSHEMASHHTWIPLQIIVDGLFIPETCYFMLKTMFFCPLVFIPSIRRKPFKTLPLSKTNVLYIPR